MREGEREKGKEWMGMGERGEESGRGGKRNGDLQNRRSDN